MKHVHVLKLLLNRLCTLHVGQPQHTPLYYTLPALKAGRQVHGISSCTLCITTINYYWSIVAKLNVQCTYMYMCKCLFVICLIASVHTCTWTQVFIWNVPVSSFHMKTHKTEYYHYLPFRDRTVDAYKR